jgi:pimeloyl-ACP methyl ester carboxylesterase
MGESVKIDSGGIALAGVVSLPSSPAATGGRRRGLVLCHGFPTSSSLAGALAGGYPDLADRLAEDLGSVVLSFDFRGCGLSEGDFSLGGWLSDLMSASAYLGSIPTVEGVWLCGFSAGGALALCAAGEDPEIRGVAAFSAPADFSDWAADPRRFVTQARAVGAIRDPTFPPDLASWARELREIRPLISIGKVPPRPILLVHGANDEVVPMLDARALADAADGQVELRILHGAGHRLRDDPRAIALLLGWFDHQVL